MVMTALFYDIHKTDEVKTERHRMTGLSADEVLYADDTICMSQSVTAMNRLLSAIQTEGAKYGLRLNKDKCELLCFGSPTGRVRFRDGEVLRPREE
eukprot:3911517-Prorocentrum_lima.AAC.1